MTIFFKINDLYPCTLHWLDLNNLKYKLIFSLTCYSQITVTLNDVLWLYLGVSWVLRKPLWVGFCAVMWVLLCIMSFNDCTRLQYQVTTHIFLN